MKENNKILKDFNGYQFIMKYAETNELTKNIKQKNSLSKISTLNSLRVEFEPFYKVISKLEFEP